MSLPLSVIAYIDPGSGAFLLQALLALLLTFGVFFRRALFAPVRFFFPKEQGSGEIVQPDGASPALDSAPDGGDGPN